MMEHGNTLSRNPNICACCSSLADGITDSDLAAFRKADTGKAPDAEGSKVSMEPAGGWRAR
jgi:hypothetical protein